MRLGVYKRIGNAIRIGGSQLMRKVSIELERDKKMCSETLSSIWSGNAPLQEQSVETLCILFDYLSRHVDSDCKPCSSSSYRARTYLDWLAQETIKETVKQAIREEIDEHKEEFKEIIKQQISSKRMKNNIALAFLATIVDCAKSTYKMPIEVKFNKEN